MRIYRFGIPFETKAELASILGVFPYSGKPINNTRGKPAPRSAYLSERDIINRFKKMAGYRRDADAIKAFTDLVQRHRQDAAHEAVREAL